jgi:sRNA-binding regulator protein Hfq
MTRRLLTISLAFAIPLTPLGPAVQAKPSKLTPKAEIEKRLNKKETRVKIKLNNGSELKGRVTQSSENGFTLSDEKSGKKTEIAYADVQNVEGRGMSKKKKGLIITAVVVGVAVTALVLALKGPGNFNLNGINVNF